MKNKPQNNPQKKVTKIVLVDAFTFSKGIEIAAEKSRKFDK